MADGLRCKHCGWQESSHEYETDPTADVRKKYYRYSLIECRDKILNFTLSSRSEREARRIKRKQDKQLEWAGEVCANRERTAAFAMPRVARDLARYAQLADHMFNPWRKKENHEY
ncbi:MAG: hypothetical protein V4697_02275 [Patescibacteria group bacterium]